MRRGSRLAFVMLSLCACVEALAQGTAVDELFETECSSGRRFPRDGEHGPPDAGASLDRLVGYWSADTRDDCGATPTPEVRARLLEACREDPGRTPSLLPYLPESDATYDWLAGQLALDGGASRIGGGAQPLLREWLRRRSRYLRPELRAAAAAARWDGHQLVGADDLTALARLDPDAAAIVCRAHADAGEPRLRALAMGLMLDAAAAAGDVARAAGLEAVLRAVVADRTAPAMAREVAVGAVVRRGAGDCDAWYLACFADPTLVDASDGYHRYPLFDPVLANPDRWVPQLAALVLWNGALRDGAARYLDRQLTHVGRQRSEPTRRDATLAATARLLLPGLADTTFPAELRRSVLGVLATADVPEAGPALVELTRTATHAALADLVPALARNGGAWREAALRDALVRVADDAARAEWHRSIVAGGTAPDVAREDVNAMAAQRRKTVAGALLDIDAFNEDELVAAIVASAVHPLPPQNEPHSELVPIDAVVGAEVLRRSRWPDLGHNRLLSESVVERLAAAAPALASSNPAAAARLLTIADAAPGRRQDLARVQALLESRVTAEMLGSMLSRRAAMRERAGSEVRALLARRGIPCGIAAVVLGDVAARDAILAGDDVEARRAVLAAARFVRDELPLEAVVRLYDAGEPVVVDAAERYLQDCDDPGARKALEARPPKRIRIRGFSSHYGLLAHWERRLSAEIEADGSIDETFALLSRGHWGHQGQIVVRVRGSRATVSHLDPPHSTGNGGRRTMTGMPWARVRDLSDAEVAELRRFVVNNDVDDRPLLETGTFHGIQLEYLHLTRQYGRRVYMNNPGVSGESAGTVYPLLCRRFQALIHGPAMQQRFAIQDALDGVEVVAIGGGYVEAVAGEGDEVRVWMRPRDGAPLEWRVLKRAATTNASETRIGAVCAAPSIVPGPHPTDRAPDIVRSDDARHPWRLRAGATCIRSGCYNGLWRCRADGSAELVADGKWSSPLTTPDGLWVVAAQARGDDSQALVRVDLASGERRDMDVAPARHCRPLAWVPARGRMLVVRSGPASYEKGEGPQVPEYYVLDVATGRCEPASGQLQPWHDLDERPFQPTGTPDEVWAAIRDETRDATTVGRYDTRSFAFTPVALYPAIALTSMEVWVDQRGQCVYAATCGRLLRLPLR